MESAMGRSGCMSRQRRSFTDIICENCKYL
ncbi:TPA: NinE family protein, partial [Escherichia coli]